MRQALFILTIIIFLCCTIACQQGEEVASEQKADVQADIQAIKDIISELNTGVNAGDSDRYLPFCADNIVVIYPNEPAYIGKEVNRKRDLKMFNEMALQDVYKVKDVKISDDMAVAHFTWSTTVEFKASGKTDSTKGNWIMVFQKQSNGAWNVIYSIWSDEGLVRPDQPAVYSPPATLGTADPIIGTWKLNFDKSKLNMSTDEQAKEEINVYRETDDNMIELSTTTLLNDGSAESSKWIWPKEGGVAKCLSREIPEGMLYVETVVEPGQWYVPIMQDGKKVAMYHKMVSKDGKTLMQTLKGIGQEGRPVDLLMVWDRQ